MADEDKATPEEIVAHERGLRLLAAKYLVKVGAIVAQLADAAGIDVTDLVADGRHLESVIYDHDHGIYRGRIAARFRDNKGPGVLMTHDEVRAEAAKKPAASSGTVEGPGPRAQYKPPVAPPSPADYAANAPPPGFKMLRANDDTDTGEE